MSSNDDGHDPFVHGLRTAMRTEVADVTASTGLLPDLHKRYVRRVVVRRVGVAAASLAVVTTVAVAVVGLPLQPSAPPASDPVTTTERGPTGSLPQVQDVAYVTSQVTSALAQVEDDVVRTTKSVNGSETQDKGTRPGATTVYTQWALGDGSAFRSQVVTDGQPVTDDSMSAVEFISVDYQDRTWLRRPSVPGGTYGDMLTPGQIAEALESGRFTIVSQGDVIDGKPTIHLRGDLGRTATPPMGFWVDPTTYLPVRVEYQQGDGDEWGSPADIVWLPPTPDNLALLTAPIPDGFTERPF